MKLRQLFESHHKVTAAFCFGRFNPAHQGHAGVWDAVAKAGHKWYIGTNPTTIGADDPLPFNVKSAWMQAIDPRIKGHIVGETSVLTLASKIYNDIGDGHYVNYITDEKDWAWSGKLLKQYNGVQGDHGYYNFKDIHHVMSPRVTSATDLRNAARAGNMDEFYRLSGTDPKLTVNGKHYYDTVAEACGLHPEKIKKTPKVKKEKPVAEPLAQENLMSFMTKPTKKKVSASAEEMRKYFEKEKSKEPDKMERGEGSKKVKQVYTKADENSIKYANKVIREMRSREFLSEISTKPSGKMHPNHVDGSQGYILSRDVGGYDRTYHLNRVMMAAAMADGRSHSPVDMDGSSWVEKYNVAFPYTDMEHAMMMQAFATVPTDRGELEKRGKSKEPEDTNTTSAVAKPKKNKYGV
jgi:hypothetical protein